MLKSLIILGVIALGMGQDHCDKVACLGGARDDNVCQIIHVSGIEDVVEVNVDMYLCKEDHYCSDIKPSERKVYCERPKLAPGTKASTKEDCYSGLISTENICLSTKSGTQACEVDMDCPTNYYCGDQPLACQAQVAVGATCIFGKDKCVSSAVCAGGKCVLPMTLADGAATTKTSLTVGWGCTAGFSNPVTGVCEKSWVQTEEKISLPAQTCRITDYAGADKSGVWAILARGDCRDIPSGQMVCRRPPSELMTQYLLVSQFVKDNKVDVDKCHVYYADNYLGLCNTLEGKSNYHKVYQAMMEIVNYGTLEHYPSCIRESLDPFLAEYYVDEQSDLSGTIWWSVGITAAVFAIALLLAIFIKF